MSLLKNSTVRKRLPAGCRESRRLFIAVDWTEKENLSDTKSGELRAGRLAFVEDFTLEHSIRNFRITATEISGVF